MENEIRVYDLSRIDLSSKKNDSYYRVKYKEDNYDFKINYIMLAILVVFISSVMLAIYFYPEPYKLFSFNNYGLSYLWRIKTVGGYDNYISRYIMYGCMIIISFLYLIQSIKELSNTDRKFNFIISVLLMFISIGVIVVMFPMDYNDTVHYFGVEILCVTFNTLIIFHFSQNTKEKFYYFIFLFTALSLSLIYIIVYFYFHQYHAFFQEITVLFMLIILIDF